MKRIWITAVGCVTSVGLRTSVTMGSLLTQTQRFDDLEVLRPDGEPLTGGAVRLPDAVLPQGRLAAMASSALAECVSSRDQRLRAPLLLATPQEQDVPGALALLSTLRAQNDAIDGERSQSFAGGRTGALRALETAVALLQNGRAESCYVGGADTLLEPVRLRVLLDEGRLIDGPGSDGFIPGEAAVFLRLESRPSPDALAVIQGAEFEGVAADSKSHVPGLLLARAARGALQEAGLVPGQISGLVHDASGPQAGFEDIALALGRLRFPQPAPLPTQIPGLSVGETGAAAPLLSLATAAFFLSKDVFPGPALTLLQGDGADRGAVVLVSAGRPAQGFGRNS